MEPDINKVMEGMPIEKYLIEGAEHLFKDRDKSRGVKFINLPPHGEKKHHSLILILNNSLSLWFFKKENGWVYDGWEMGDYTNSWTTHEI